MNTTFKIFTMLLGATLALNVAMNYMGDNIEDFENRPLPPKRPQTAKTDNPVIQVDAQNKEKWTLVDFSTKKSFQISDPEMEKKLLNSQSWDLGFQRTKIISNGGVTNPRGTVKVANLGPINFDNVLDIPQSNFLADKRSWGNVNNPSLVDWYLYRTRTHNIESKRNVYLVKTEDGHLKIRILNYYCNRQESDCQTSMCPRDEAACLTIEYQFLPAGQKKFSAPANTSSQTTKVAP